MLIDINRLLSFEDVVEKYGGPPSMWASLRPYLPVWRSHEGTPIYLESQVDEFLHALQHRWSVQSDAPEVAPITEQRKEDEFLTIAQARERFLGGKKSKEWWYKMVNTGKLPHHRAGGSIMLKFPDVVRFIDSMKVKEPEPLPQPEQPTPFCAPPPRTPSQKRRGDDQSSGFKFFRK